MPDLFLLGCYRAGEDTGMSGSEDADCLIWHVQHKDTADGFRMNRMLFRLHGSSFRVKRRQHVRCKQYRLRIEFRYGTVCIFVA